MTEPSIPAELTLRDVLSQVDRRLTLIEGDLRDLEDRFDLRSDRLRTELCGGMTALNGELRGAMGVLRDELRGEMGVLRDELRGEMTALKGELRGDMGVLRDELRGDMAALRTDLLGRMDSRFTWSIATTVAIGGILLAAIKI
jgi:hypothetical protein